MKKLTDDEVMETLKFFEKEILFHKRYNLSGFDEERVNLERVVKILNHYLYIKDD